MHSPGLPVHPLQHRQLAACKSITHSALPARRDSGQVSKSSNRSSSSSTNSNGLRVRHTHVVAGADPVAAAHSPCCQVGHNVDDNLHKTVTTLFYLAGLGTEALSIIEALISTKKMAAEGKATKALTVADITGSCCIIFWGSIACIQTA